MPDVGEKGSYHHQHYCARRQRSHPRKEKPQAPNDFNRRNGISRHRGISPVRKPGCPLNGRWSFDFRPPDKNKQRRQKDCVDPHRYGSEILHWLSPSDRLCPRRSVLPSTQSLLNLCVNSKNLNDCSPDLTSSRIRHASGSVVANASVF